MGPWISAASAAVPATLAAVLALRVVNRRSARRFRAAFIDLAIATAVVGLVWGVVALLLEISGSGRASLGLDIASTLGLIFAGVFMLLRDDLPLQRSGSRSPGKAHQHLRVARRSSAPMTPAVSILRNLPLVAVPLVGFPSTAPYAARCSWSRSSSSGGILQGRRLGDRIAGTQVMFRRHGRSRGHRDRGSGALKSSPPTPDALFKSGYDG